MPLPVLKIWLTGLACIFLVIIMSLLFKNV